MDQRRPATMRDVAARAGVSRSLVSTVFRNVPGASPATRARVLAAAAELGYTPDDRARRLRSRRSRVIGVTLTATQPFHVAFVEALHDDADLRGYELSISLSTDSRPLARAIDTLLAQRCAAMILVGPTATTEEIGLLAAQSPGVPLIVVDGHVDLPTIDALRIDDGAALMASVTHLVGLGHHRIWYTDGGDFVSAEPRRAAYLAAMAAHGLSSEVHLLPSGGTAMAGAQTGLDMLTGGTLPTALVAYNDRSACGLINVLSRRGIRIPQDLSIVGFDNIPEAAMPHISLTTVEQLPQTLVTATAETVMRRLDGAPAGGLHLLKPGPLVVRTSSGRPRVAPLRVVAG
ncbi:MAG: LacI family DNA-binding transcriptional regulator [Actinobacteria bacterium]|nr:LacI family DNA-binding transcriptional regulator [Actinomycetota bacterium]